MAGKLLDEKGKITSLSYYVFMHCDTAENKIEHAAAQMSFWIMVHGWNGLDRLRRITSVRIRLIRSIRVPSKN